jgi:hypothetical protein
MLDEHHLDAPHLSPPQTSAPHPDIEEKKPRSKRNLISHPNKQKNLRSPHQAEAEKKASS